MVGLLVAAVAVTHLLVQILVTAELVVVVMEVINLMSLVQMQLVMEQVAAAVEDTPRVMEEMDQVESL
tara:strand:- start:76 stop:279 length:204 start_codon:yes stop_codon:yes gene_type:complete